MRDSSFFSAPCLPRRALAVAVLLAACAVPANAQTPASSLSSSPESWGTISRGSLRSVLAPKLDIKLSSRAAGVVEKIHVAEGATVSAGEAIISLDSQQEEAEVAQSLAVVRGIEAELERVTNEFARAQALFEDKISSDKQYDESRSLQKVTASRLDQATAALALSQVRLNIRTIRSPIDGIFLKTVKSVGEAVERHETIARVIDASTLRFVLYSDYSLLGRFAAGEKVAVLVQTAPRKETRVEGTITHLDPVVDSTSGTFRIVVEVKPSVGAIAGFAAMLVIGEK